MPSYSPTYSHGGNGANGAVTGAGRAISVYSAIQSCAMYIACVGGTATVKIEANGSAVDSTGEPNSDAWIDMSDGGYVFADGDVAYKIIPATKAPFWRTNITAISGATVESGISQIIVSGSAGFPTAVRANYPLKPDHDRTRD